MIASVSSFCIQGTTESYFLLLGYLFPSVFFFFFFHKEG